MRTSTRCSRLFQNWRTRILGSLKLSLLIVLSTTSFLSSSWGQGGSVSVDFTQGSNKNNTLGNIVWINSILQKTNSRIAEGMSTLQRVELYNIPTTSSTHTVQFKILTQKSTYHAYDFITSWGQALRFTDMVLPTGIIYPAYNGGNYYSSTGMNKCADLQTGGQSPTETEICDNLHTGAEITPTKARDVLFPMMPAAGAIPAGLETNFDPSGGSDIRTTQQVINAYESIFGQRSVRIISDQPITAASIVFNNYDADYGTYTLTYTSANSTQLMVEFGVHVASGVDALTLGMGYGAGRGAHNISGGPYHVKYQGFDSDGGDMDNQLQGSEIFLIPNCTIPAISNVCKGASPFNVTANVSNVDANTTYTWTITPVVAGGPTISGTTETATVTLGTATGSFTVNLHVANGEFTHDCSRSFNINAVTLSLGKTDVSCNGGSNGTVTATFSGGTSPYTATLDGVSQGTVTSPKTFNNLSAGNHTVIITDASGCSASSAISVGQPSALSLSLSKADVSCNGGTNGSVTATFSGGTSPYTATLDGVSQGTVTSPKTFNNLSAGNHTVAITDANGCSTSSSISVSQPAAISLSLSKADVSCNGGSNGSVTATFSGGSSPYTATLDGVSQGTVTSPKTFNNLSAGNHTVAITDANGCSTSSSISVGQPGALSISLSKSDVSCNGGTNGSVTATFSGGTSPYTATLDGVSQGTVTSPKAFNNLAAGNHTVVITDSHGCTTSSSISIGQPSALSLSLAKADVSCNGGTNGSVTATFSGGTSPYTATLDGVSQGTVTSPKTFNNLSAGNHTVAITDANGCSTSSSISVGQPSALSISLSKTDASCNGNANGSVTATFSGGTSPYTATLDGVSQGTVTSPKTFNGLAAGNHTVVITDNHGCTTSSSISVGQPSSLTASASKTDVSCNGGTNGSMTVTFSGGTSPYTATLDGVSQGTVTSPKTFNNLAAGNHTVVITDASGCAVNATASVGQPSALSISLSKSNVSCNGGSNGSVTATFSGGTSPYTATLDGVSQGTVTSPKTFNNLSAGNHTVAITDANGCSTSSSISVGQPNALSISLSKADVSCNGGSNGSVTATFSGGTSPYTATLDGVSQGAVTSPKTFSGLSAGSHTVAITDANGCSTSSSISVGQPGALSLSLTATEEHCGSADGSITATFSGGTSPYTATLDGVSQGTITSPKTFNGLTSGSHTVVLTDANGCSTSSSVSVGVTECTPACSFTQGFYGNVAGLGCNGDGSAPSLAKTKMLAAFGADTKVVFGRTNVSGTMDRAFTLFKQDIVNNNIFLMLPGGGPNAVLGLRDGGTTPATGYGGASYDGSTYSVTASWGVVPIPTSGAQTGRIRNNLLAQTITLWFNTRNNVTLANMPLKDTLITVAMDCATNEAVPGALDRKYGIPHQVILYMLANGGTYTNDVKGLLKLANDALGGATLVNVKLDSIQRAVDVINNAFDGCRLLTGTLDYVQPIVLSGSLREGTAMTEQIMQLSVTAYPNPFNDVVKFTISSPVSGRAQLEVMNVLGQKIATVYNGYMQANKVQVVEFKANATAQQDLLYIFSIGDRRVTGKLLNVKK